MLTFIRTDNSNRDFKTLVKLLDQNLKITDGDEHEFYNQFNGIEKIKHVLVVYKEEILIGCGAIKHHDINTAEVKRMYVLDQIRGQGIATEILGQLELWAEELGYHKCILETGSRQHSAIALYKKNEYEVIDNYEQYLGVENSVCFGKTLH